MESGKDWRAQAEALFFVEHLSVQDISQIVGRTRKYVTLHLQACERYEAEREWRKQQNARNRLEYKREWDREHRTYCSQVTADTMRREHDMAVLELSREIYH